MTQPSSILAIEPLGMPWETLDPFLFCVHHDDAYPAGTDVSERPYGERDDYTSLVWLAGVTALQNLGRPNDAVQMFKRYAGRELKVDEHVYASESTTGHRNRAIGYMLRNFNVLEQDPMPVVETYFQQCSILGHCRDLAAMAATLANRGVNPLTNEQAIRGEYVESVLGVMGTCGMYDYAGEWLYDVGMPAKSGVAGGVIAVR